MKRRIHQGGMGMLGWLFVIAVVGGGVTVGTQLVPVYMDNNTIVTVMDSFSTVDNLANKSDANIYADIKKRLNVNNVREFPIKENIKINRSRDGAELVMDYEVRIDLIRNLDLVASFEHTARLQD